ncbi:MAG: DUF6463 family protein [Clostridiales bacterium]|nr:DUF6463 family protein [Clostridiales bacterium]
MFPWERSPRRETGIAPACPIGYYLLALSIFGCLFIPVSGFWLFIPQAIIIINSNSKVQSS